MATAAERQKAYRERKKKKAEKSNEQAMFASSVPGEYIIYTETRPGHFVANVVEGNPDDLPPVEIPAETLTYFDVYKRRHDGMFK